MKKKNQLLVVCNKMPTFIVVTIRLLPRHYSSFNKIILMKTKSLLTWLMLLMGVSASAQIEVLYFYHNGQPHQ